MRSFDLRETCNKLRTLSCFNGSTPDVYDRYSFTSDEDVIFQLRKMANSLRTVSLAISKSADKCGSLSLCEKKLLAKLEEYGF